MKHIISSVILSHLLFDNIIEIISPEWAFEPYLFYIVFFALLSSECAFEPLSSR